MNGSTVGDRLIEGVVAFTGTGRVAEWNSGKRAMDRATGDAAWTNAVDGAEAGLTAAEKMSLTYLPPAADLQPFVTTYFLFRCDEHVIRDVQPAAVGQLQVYLRGHGRMLYPHGRTDRSFPETLQGPTTVAAPFDVEGPFHTFGAALSALGWAALTGLAADKAADRLHDANAVLGPGAGELGAAVRAAYERDPTTDGSALAEMADEFVRARLRPLPKAHMEVVGQVTAWLGSSLHPPVQALYDSSSYSPRQVQRIVARYFGSSPTHLVRAYRATRVVALLSEPGVSDARVAALTDEFYDQSHMIREIREFTGRTPSRLLADDDSIVRTLLDVRNFREIEPNVAPLPRLESDDDDA
ncbi:Helix-turn-helix domain protein [Tsuneonella dongtanensis]|uniref:Helix-turn-helix domain protein n=1 Tax=Tsuneonella dongtanensis TaxID=692370 RepID=A0A1B2AA87_9SPHN|nr:helix-turn-helix domain-containing protein [Tsuneonella dongtanensis]ANY19056.1 Helix-turn-helix domain protein [Tsuneonella dongtanensis]